MKYDFTRHVELAWVSPFRRYAPVLLIFLVAILIAVTILLPLHTREGQPWSAWTWTGVVVTYLALAALGFSLFLFLKSMDRVARDANEDIANLFLANEQLNTILRSIDDGVISTNVNGAVTLVNDVAAHLTGWTKETALGQRLDKVFHIIDEQTRAEKKSPFEHVIKAGMRIHGDFHSLLVARDGAERAISHSAAPLLDYDGWLIGAVVVFRAATALREAQRQREVLIQELSAANDRLRREIAKSEESRRAALSLMQDTEMAKQALQESEQRLRILFEGIDDALFVLDRGGRILDCNRAACERLGYTRNHLLALNIADINADRLNYPVAEWHVTSDGRRVPGDVHTSTIHYAGQEATLAVARDITELRKAQDELRAINTQLRESNAALEEYARVASHDLQDPLRKIESFSQILLEDYGRRLDDQGRMYLDVLVRAAGRMRRLIKAVLAYSRAGVIEAPRQPLDLNKVLAAVRENLSEVIERRSAVIEAGPLPTVDGDEIQMIQLLQNLIANGLKFNESHPPRVSVTANDRGAEWEIRVADNGIGMTPQERAKLFMPFKRLHPREKYDGTGIGLAVCRKIVLRHGGRIDVESEPNRGSVFWFTLPKPAEPVTAEAAPDAETEKGSEP